MTPDLSSCPAWFKNLILIASLALLGSLTAFVVGRTGNTINGYAGSIAKLDERINLNCNRITALEEAVKTLPRMEHKLDRLTEHLLSRPR